MEEYIKFYLNENNELNAKIHKKGQHRNVRNQKNIKKLIKIASKYGYIVDGEGIIEQYALNIRKEFDEYMNSKKNKLKIYNNVNDNMKISHKNISINKKVIAGTLALALAITTFHNIKATSDINDNNEIVYDDESISKKENATIYKDDTIKIVDETTEKNNKNNDINKIFEKDAFHFSYENRNNDERIINSKKYEDIFKKYAKEFGLDANLLMALASQESSGDHYNNLGTGPAEGIMQIEKAVHIGTTISAYNFNTNEIESIKITESNLQDLDTNIKIGAMILRDYIEKNNYNIPLSLQTYNFGPGNMSKVLSTCSEIENIDIEEMINNSTNNDWLNYRSFLQIGDPEYVEHVFSFLPNNSKLTVLDRNNNKISVTIANDYTKAKKI